MASVIRVVAILVVVGLSSATSLSSLRDDWHSSRAEWATGPAWYLMTANEYREHRRLRTDSQRTGFAKRFWEVRDPIPETEQNELEREFWRRVETADMRFRQGVKPGWKTARGKVYILLGPPENYEQDQIYADSWGSERWIYDLGALSPPLRLVLQEALGIPSGRRFVSLKVRGEPVGSRSVSGSTALDDSVLRPTGALQLAESLLRLVPGPEPLRQLGHLMRVPELRNRPDSTVNVTTVFGHVPVHARVDFRPAERVDTRTSVAITLGVSVSDLAAAGLGPRDRATADLLGRLTSVEGEQRSYSLTGTFRPDLDTGPQGTSTGQESNTGEEATQVFQAVASIPPGRYLLEISYRHSRGPVSGSVRDFIEVPVFSSDGLTVSSIILSSRLEKMEAPAPPGASPFILGRYRVVPRINRVYAGPEELTIFYQVYGASMGSDRRAHLDLSYQFYLEDADAWLPIGGPITFPGETDLAQAWRVPLHGLPTGRYRLEVSVRDRVQKVETSREVLFEIDPV